MTDKRPIKFGALIVRSAEKLPNVQRDEFDSSVFKMLSAERLSARA